LLKLSRYSSTTSAGSFSEAASSAPGDAVIHRRCCCTVNHDDDDDDDDDNRCGSTAVNDWTYEGIDDDIKNNTAVSSSTSIGGWYNIPRILVNDRYTRWIMEDAEERWFG
jgi:hypothetical protein